MNELFARRHVVGDSYRIHNPIASTICLTPLEIESFELHFSERSRRSRCDSANESGIGIIFLLFGLIGRRCDGMPALSLHNRTLLCAVRSNSHKRPSSAVRLTSENNISRLFFSFIVGEQCEVRRLRARASATEDPLQNNKRHRTHSVPLPLDAAVFRFFSTFLRCSAPQINRHLFNICSIFQLISFTPANYYITRHSMCSLRIRFTHEFLNIFLPSLARFRAEFRSSAKRKKREKCCLCDFPSSVYASTHSESGSKSSSRRQMKRTLIDNHNNFSWKMKTKKGSLFIPHHLALVKS